MRVISENILLDLQQKIATNGAAIARLEQALIDQPRNVVIQATLRSLRKLHSVLTTEVRKVGG